VSTEFTTTIVVADDHPLFRGALRQALGALLPRARVLEATGLDDLSALLERERDLDLILLDLTMPGVQGFSGLIYLRAQHPAVPVVIVSGTDEPVTIRRAMEFGASGFVPKSLEIERIGEALATVLDGGTWVPADIDLSGAEDKETADLVRRLATLTPQQVRVLMMLSEGLLNKQIAYELGVSEATVKAHVSAILQKLGVDSRTQAVIVAAKIGATQRARAVGE
jgi:DNA-binding NarL/FixJ family response regulator